MRSLKGVENQEFLMLTGTYPSWMLGVVLSLYIPFAAAQERVESPGEQEPSTTPNVIELRQQANTAYQAEDWESYREALTRLHQMRPYNSEYMYQLVLAHALAKDRSSAYNMMLYMQQQGLAADFDLAPDAEFIRGTEAYVYINDLLRLAGEPAGQAEQLFELPKEVVLATSIVWDPGREVFLVGTAREGVVFAVTRDGETREILRADDENGLWGIYGLLLDTQGNRLWVSSGANANFAGYDQADAGRSALFEFDLESMELIKRYPVPADGRPHRLGGMVRTPGGDVYAVDTILPIVYHLAKGSDRLAPFVASGDMVSLRGVTLDDTGSLLYIADYEMGIMVLDLAGKRAMKLQVPETFNLGGIEGMFFWEGHLVLIQNGIEPQRIMRLKLSLDGTSVTEVAPLAVAQPFFNFPNFGTVLDGQLYFFANSHWIRNLETLEPIRLARSPVASAPALVAPDMEEVWKNYQQRSQSISEEGGD
jgi:hypothetical protein